MEWPIDKWKKLSMGKKAYTVEPMSDEWHAKRRAYRKKFIADGVVKVHSVCDGMIQSVSVNGICVGSWTIAQQGHEIVATVCDTIWAMNGGK